MGLLSSIWKGVKNVFKGIGKVFGAILKPIGKILNTKWGKALLLAVSVFTFGAAFLAGGAAFSGSMAAGNGFIASFVEGGKAFVGSLLGTTGGGDKGVEAVTEGVSGGGEIAAAESGTMAQRAVTESAPGGALSQASKVDNMNRMGEIAKTAGGVAQAEGGNWLTKAAKGAWDFAKSDAGQNLIGGAMTGYAEGERDQAFIDSRERYDRMWKDPEQTKPINDLSEGFQPEVPGVWNRDPSAISNQRIKDYKPSVPYTRAPQPAGG